MPVDRGRCCQDPAVHPSQCKAATGRVEGAGFGLHSNDTRQLRRRPRLQHAPHELSFEEQLTRFGSLCSQASDVECFQPWQQGLFAVFAPLLLFPFILLLVTRVAYKNRSGRWAWKGYANVVIDPYAKGFSWWSTVVLCRRLVLVVLTTFVPPERIIPMRFFVLVLLAASFSVNILLWPHKFRSVQILDNACHFVLVVAAAMALVVGVREYDGLPTATGDFSAFVAVLVILPLVGCVSLILLSLLAYAPFRCPRNCPCPCVSRPSSLAPVVAPRMHLVCRPSFELRMHRRLQPLLLLLHPLLWFGMRACSPMLDISLSCNASRANIPNG